MYVFQGSFLWPQFVSLSLDGSCIIVDVFLSFPGVNLSSLRNMMPGKESLCFTFTKCGKQIVWTVHSSEADAWLHCIAASSTHEISEPE